MAGGRRPASYVAGARHNAGVDRAATAFDSPTSPQAGATGGAALPPWIPSIWQAGAKPAAEALPPRAQSPFRHDPSSALAAALDSAVQSAVVRALGSAPAAPASPRSVPAAPAPDKPEEPAPEPPWAAREREFVAVIDALQKRVDEKDKDIRDLSERLLGLERRVTVDADVANHREERYSTDMARNTKKMADALAQSEKRLDGRLGELEDQLKSSQGSLAKIRASQKHFETERPSVKKWTHELSTRMDRLDINVDSELAKVWFQFEHLEQSFDGQLAKMSAGLKFEPSAASRKEFAELKRCVEANTESVATLRSKLKRVETQMSEVAKQSSDMIALNSGFEETMQENLAKVTSVIEGLRTTVAEMKRDLSARTGATVQGDVGTRLETVESNLKALKKLIESNLRTQWNAESIVKEQVSLITKHVCVAMRQYTARRISENNVHIDQALRARVPEYAKNEDQFVLVPEQDPERNESIDVHRSSEVSSNASS